MDVNGGSPQSGANIQLWDCAANPQENKIFIVPQKGLIRWGRRPDLCLDISGGSTADGTNVKLWNCRESNANQIFELAESGGQYQIKWAAHPDKCIDVSG